MAAINVEEITTKSVTLEYCGIVVKFCLGVNNRPERMKTEGPYHTLQGWEKKDLFAKAAAILRK